MFSSWVNAGVYVCGPKVLRYVSARGPQDFARDLFPRMLREGCRILAYPTDARVVDYGSPDRLEIADEAIRQGWLRRSPAERSC